MQGAGDHLLAGATLPGDVYGPARGRCLADLVAHRAELRGPAEQAEVIVGAHSGPDDQDGRTGADHVAGGYEARRHGLAVDERWTGGAQVPEQPAVRSGGGDELEVRC